MLRRAFIVMVSLFAVLAIATVTGLPGHASEVDHYTVELKAWIPQATVPATINSPVVCAVGQYMGAPKHYKGDDHVGYDGSYRVLVTYSFTWDGNRIGDVAVDVKYGATHLMQDGCPDLVKTVTREGDVTASGASSFQMHMSSANPIEPFAPTIDSTLKGTFTRPDELSLDLKSDKFPSHGFRVIKNGQIIATVVDFDASCVTGAESIAQGLSASYFGTWHVGHQDVDLNVPGQSFFGPCGQPRPPSLTYPASTSVPTPRPAPVTYAWAWQAQDYYTDSSKRTKLDLNDMQPGQSAWIVLTAKNTGNATWYRSGQYPMMLGTSHPIDRSSKLVTSGWVSNNRPGAPFPSSGTSKRYRNI